MEFEKKNCIEPCNQCIIAVDRCIHFESSHSKGCALSIRILSFNKQQI